ncbi:unknown [Firmicutes bacterium CAG:822]|nr:unknown [Firmicutes bacterium CAG:822]
MNNFIEILLDVISNSPSSVLFIILGIIFASAMIINIKNKKKIGKLVSILGWIFIVLFIIIRYSSYLNKLFDNLINNIFMQIFFPNLATYVIIIIITNFIFLYSIIKKTSNLSKVINVIFFTVIMVFMLYTLEQIITNNINIYSFEKVYSNDDISVLIQSTTVLFTFWIILIISKLIINKLIEKSIKNIKNEEKDNISEKQDLSEIQINNTNSQNLEAQNNINNKDDSDDDDIEILTL